MDELHLSSPTGSRGYIVDPRCRLCQRAASCPACALTHTPPTAADDSAQTDADMPVVIDLLANDSDADGSLDPASLDVVTNPASGTLSDNGDGTLVYAPDSGFSGSDSFSYRVADDEGAWSNTASVEVTVNSVTPPPSGDPVSINSTSANTLLPASPVAERPIAASNDYKVLAANDLGMHCADLDYQVFSILPPFNVVHAQVVKRGVGNGRPQLMDDSDIDLFYSAASSAADPALSKDPVSPVFKSNFWGDPDSDGRTFGYDTYAPLFFGLLLPTDIDIQDQGLPVPDSHLLRDCLIGYLDGSADASTTRQACQMVQQAMPGLFAPFSDNQPPGETDLQRLLNTAKINILRVHDRKHGTDLDASRPVQCATCHYTPALDLAQLGPMSAGEVDQTGHITMSRAMHGHHGELAADPSKPFDAVTNNLFPDMPAPDDPLRQALALDHYPDATDEFQTVTEYVLEKTCYSCHPGKRTQCLRGAMAAGGVVCQDCHGQARHAGTIVECDTCHDASAFEDSGDLELTTNGPHGMHAVGSFRWNKSHKEARTAGGANCQACHGTSGDGSVLSRMATDRMLWCKDEKGLMCDSEGWTLFPEGHEVGCADCHTKKQ